MHLEGESKALAINGYISTKSEMCWSDQGQDNPTVTDGSWQFFLDDCFNITMPT